jgi:hypothetical protein
MLGPDVVVIEFTRFHRRERDDLAGTVGEPFEHRRPMVLPAIP